jgi:hypothetical protein
MARCHLGNLGVEPIRISQFPQFFSDLIFQEDLEGRKQAVYHLSRLLLVGFSQILMSPE